MGVSLAPLVEEEHEMEQFEPDPSENKPNEVMDETLEDLDIFSKFKKISETETSDENATVTMQQIYTKLLELEESMHTKHAEIMAHLSNGKLH